MGLKPLYAPPIYVSPFQPTMPKCPQCPGKTFGTEDLLELHMKNSPKGSHPYCSMCDKMFRDMSAYVQHAATKKHHVCRKCNRAHQTPEALEEHYKTSTVHPTCTLCAKGFLNDAIYEAHNVALHSVESVCTPCKRTFKSAQALEDHYKRYPTCIQGAKGFPDEASYRQHNTINHPSPKVIVCPPCNRTYGSLQALEEHYKGSAKHPTCLWCSKGFFDDAAYEQHKAVQHGAAVICHTCSLPYDSFEALEDHYRESSQHPTCLRCVKGFSDDETYQHHNTTVRHPPTYICHSCYCTFNSTEALEGHYKESPLHPNCARCGIGFFDNARQEEHHITAHPKIRCMVCGGISMYEDLAEHHYLESQNHPTCSHCNHGFETDVLYDEHVRFVHPDFCCQLCNRPFESQDALQIHYRFSPKHERCMDCDVGFKDGEAYIAHLVLSHSPSTTLEAEPTKLSEPEELSAATKPRALDINEEIIVCPFESKPLEECAPIPEPEKVASTSELIVHDDVGTPFSRRLDINSHVKSAKSSGYTSSVISEREMSMSSSLESEPLSRSSTPSLSGLYEVVVEDSRSRMKRKLDELPYISRELHQRPSLSLSTHSESPDQSEKDTSPSSSGESPAISSPVGLSPLPYVYPTPSTPTETVETTWFGFDPSNVSLPSSHSAAPIPIEPGPSASSPLQEYHEDIRPVADPFGGDLLTELLPEVSPMSEYAQSPSRPPAWNRHDTIDRKPLKTIHETPVSEPQQQHIIDAQLQENADEITVHPPTTCIPVSLHRLHCRICHLDPCNNITATICGHIFCNRCIAESVALTSRCPVCTMPTPLYCLFKLDLSD